MISYFNWFLHTSWDLYKIVRFEINFYINLEIKYLKYTVLFIKLKVICTSEYLFSLYSAQKFYQICHIHWNIQIIFVIYSRLFIIKNEKFDVLNLPQMQPFHQKPFNNDASFDSHLHCSSPLHSNAHDNKPKVTGVSLISKALQTMKEFRCSLVFLCLPYWIVFVLLLRKVLHAYKEVFDIGVFIMNFFKLCFIIIIIQLQRLQEFFYFVIGKSIINSTLYSWQKVERNPY
jgi:hypothetical protein